ncbi:bbs5 [Scenedesmus sp. PABB004]|nr:bbs5 [Scenedesmus sp. PABB004]
MEPPSPGLAKVLFGRRGDDAWCADREIRFDAPAAQLACRRGEEVLETFDAVEDTKGNNGDGGRLTLTNLRATWVSGRAPRTNISIGLNTITSCTVKPASSRLKGSCSAVYLLTRLRAQRFEFIFTALADGHPSLPDALQAVIAAYDASRPYRELRLRGALLVGKELRLLPRETAYSRVNGVWNLASETGSLGTLVITSVRLVWHSSLSDAFNVSMPYAQIKGVRVADSKFGPALVVETTAAAGGYVLGFRVDPRETLDYVHKEAASLLTAYTSCPQFGVEYDAGAAAPQPPAVPEAEEPEVDERETPPDAWAAYFEDGGRCDEEREPVLSAELGLAIEPPKDGASLAQLWSIL